MSKNERKQTIQALKGIFTEYELRAKYNGGADYEAYRALDQAISEMQQNSKAYEDGYKAGYAQAQLDSKGE